MQKTHASLSRQSHLFPSFSGVTGAFSARKHQNMSLVYAETADSLENRRLFLRGLNINYQDLVCAEQIHGAQIKRVGKEERGKGALSHQEACAAIDALITNEVNLPLAIFTADCLSIFLYDPKKLSIGLVHAGWGGTKEDIAAKAIALMKDEMAIQPQDLFVGFGPAIRDCCYEVGSEFKDFLSFGLLKRDNRYYLDLAGINKKQLLDSGVKEANIFDSGICTCCENQEFFSYRKEGQACGRMMSVIMLK